MADDLVQICAEISRAGYEGRQTISSRLYSPELLKLGKFLLSDADTFPLRWNAGESQGTLAIGFGGGIDSYCALLEAAQRYDRIVLVHTNYGQPYVENEREVFNCLEKAWRHVKYGYGLAPPEPCAAPFAGDLHLAHPKELTFKETYCRLVPSARSLDWGWKDYVVPARNLVIAAICSAYADTVWIVANKRTDETVGARDKTSRFYHQASDVFTDYYGRRTQVESPFLSKSKLEVVKETLAKFNNIKALKATFSCYTPTDDDQHCGVCYACYKRYKLFQALNEEFSFARHPIDGPHYSEFEATEKRKRG